jgi:hypothetical protein
LVRAILNGGLLWLRVERGREEEEEEEEEEGE